MTDYHTPLQTQQRRRNQAMTHTYELHIDNPHCIDCGHTLPPDPFICPAGEIRRANEEIYRLKQVMRRAYLYLNDIDLGWGLGMEAAGNLLKENME